MNLGVTPGREPGRVAEERTVQEIESLKSAVQRAAYVVDPRAVAEALMRRLVDEQAQRAESYVRLTERAAL